MPVTSFFVALVALLASCMQVDINMPKGAKGDKGEKGDPGMSAYDLWKSKVEDGTLEWDKNAVAVVDFFKYLKGKDGQNGHNGTNGTNGLNGKSAYELWKLEVAKGSVDDPHNPGQKVDPAKTSMQDFWRFLTGATGESGQTPHIDKKTGNWFIGTKNTGIAARGDKGADAVAPKVTINPDTHEWLINGKGTGVIAKGKDGTNGTNGQDGANGKDAYELWKEAIKKEGGLPNPMDPCETWPADKDSEADFWTYLTGSEPTCKPAPIITPVAITGMEKLSDPSLKYVDPKDGSVTFIVKDANGKKVLPGAMVTGLPGVPNPGKTYTADSEGKIRVPKEDLPFNDTPILGKAKVNLPGESTPVNSVKFAVPNYVEIRLVHFGTSDSVKYPLIQWYSRIYFYIKYRTSPKGNFSRLPNELYPFYKDAHLDVHKVKDMNNPDSIDDSYSIHNSGAYGSSFRYDYSESIYCAEVAPYRFLRTNNVYGSVTSYHNPGAPNQEKTVDINESIFFTVRSTSTLYGCPLKWSGTCELPVYQMPPVIKSLTITKKDSMGNATDMEGVLDFSHMDMTKITRHTFKETKKNGVTILQADYYTEEEAKNLNMVRVRVGDAHPYGVASYNNPNFTVTGFTRTDIYVNVHDKPEKKELSYYQNFFHHDTRIGYLKKDKNGKFYVDLRRDETYNPTYRITVTEK